MLSFFKSVAKQLPAPLQNALRGARDVVLAFSYTAARPYLAMKRQQRRRSVREIETTHKPIALFLSPDAGLEVYHAPHAIIARTIAHSGLKPIFLSCEGLLPTCTLKEVHSVGPTVPGAHTKTCSRCRHVALAAGNNYGLTDISIESLVTPQDRDEIAKITTNSIGWLVEFSLDDIPFGAFVLGDTLRRRRLTAMSEFGERDNELFRALLYTALAIYFAVRTLAGRFDIRRILFFGDYAYWLPIQAFAAKKSIGLAGLDYGYNTDIDQRYIGLRPVSANVQALDKVNDWPRYRNTPLPAHIATEIFEGGLHRLGSHGGRTNFSPNWIRRSAPLQKELGLSEKRKTIIAYPSSSDEFVAQSRILAAFGKRFASQPRPFADQFAWLDALIEWVKNRDDLQLVVRWHPRMGMGLHSTLRASEYAVFKQHFADHPSNVVMIWPEDKASSYNLGEICDVATVSWSTIGLELARLGVPVVASFPDIGTYPVGSFIGFGSTSAEYFQVMEEALSKPALLSSIIEAIRWTHYIFWSPLVDVSDVIPTQKYHNQIPDWREPKNSDIIKRVIVDGEDLSVLNMTRLKNGGMFEAAERTAVLSAIEKAVKFFLVDPCVSADGGSLKNLHALPGGWVTGHIDGKIIRRYSPMAARLAAMLSVEAISTVTKEYSA